MSLGVLPPPLAGEGRGGGGTAPGGHAPIPPYPPRLTARIPPWEALRRFRADMLSVWHERHFEEPWFETRLLARRAFVCNSPETVQEAFVARHAALERKSPQLRHALRPLIGEGLFASDGAVWRARRRPVAAVTHVSRLPALAPAITEAVAERRAAWAARGPGARVDMLAEMGGLAAEVVCRALFGRAVGAGEAAREAAAAFTAYLARVAGHDLPSLLGLPDWVPRLNRLRVGAEARRFHAVLDRLVAAAEPGSLMRAMAAEGGFSARALREEAAVVFLAGHETTASALAWCWVLLDAAPAAAARLRAEARGALAGRTAGLDDLPRLPFARAVVEEALRLYPPVPLLAREALRDTGVAGRPVRRGTIVLALPWLLHRHRALWDRPDHFLPDRFLPGAAPPRPRHAFIPFGLGPRVCTGAQFALAEAVTALASLAQDAAPRLAPGAEVRPVCRLSLRPGPALPMLLDAAPPP